MQFVILTGRKALNPLCKLLVCAPRLLQRPKTLHHLRYTYAKAFSSDCIVICGIFCRHSIYVVRIAVMTTAKGGSQ